MLQRFEGHDGARRLATLLLRQTLVAGDAGLADAIAERCTVEQLDPGTTLIHQGGADTDLFFILSGQLSILVNGRPIASRSAGAHVGEMAIIDPASPRSASVTAVETVVVARVGEAEFAVIAAGFPDIWQRIALELADRLRQRSQSHHEPNVIPHVFVGCSSEALAVGTALRNALEDGTLSVSLWTDGVFAPGDTTIESLSSEMDRTDFAVLVATADDVVQIRGAEQFAPRDNVVFELGLFMGALGKGRALLMPSSGIDLRIPTDLLGVTPVRFEHGDDSTLTARVGFAADQIRALIAASGPR